MASHPEIRRLVNLEQVYFLGVLILRNLGHVVLLHGTILGMTLKTHGKCWLSMTFTHVFWSDKVCIDRKFLIKVSVKGRVFVVICFIFSQFCLHTLNTVTV